jgi:succinate dehydrogenase / fumarate reductase, cytochrome b subunit
MASRSPFQLSSVITKVLVATTGLLLFLYLLVHLVGNLLLFLGPRTFNGYAHALISNPIVIPVEVGLLLIFLLHVYETFMMWLHNRDARPLPYQKKERAGPPSRKTIASSTMFWTGLAMLAFVVVQVRTFKYGTYYQVAGTEERDLFRLVAEIFSNPAWVALYAGCMVLVGFHLWHGFGSAFESLGGNHPRYTPKLQALGKVLAVIIAGGFFLIPLWLFFGGRS